MGLLSNRRLIAGGFCFCILFSKAVQAAPVCPERASPPRLQRIVEVMATGRFVAYQPTSHQVYDGVSSQADPASIAEDLKVLRPRFDGLITYASKHGIERVPEIAARLGYRAVIMGLQDITDAKERANVAAAAHANRIVAGVSVGNEIMYGKRGTFSDISNAMAQMRAAAPGVAVATTEPFHLLLTAEAAPVLNQSDLLLANVHPVFEPWFKAAPDANAAEFVVNVAGLLAQAHCGPLLVKESGVPTAPADKGFKPERQAAFYAELQRQFAPSDARAFAYFSAFDAPWREFDAHPTPGPHPEEAHWGLYDQNRREKPVVKQITPLPRR
jgi:exo-beta-1,3-glucanase (GH17 family)